MCCLLRPTSQTTKKAKTHTKQNTHTHTHPPNKQNLPPAQPRKQMRMSLNQKQSAVIFRQLA